MSVVVAKRSEKGFIIGCDSIVISGQVKDETTKIFRAKHNKDIVCGVVGTLRDLNILSIMDNILDATAVRRNIIDTESIIKETLPNIKNALKENGRIMLEANRGEYMGSSFIIAYKDKCWKIGQDFSVIEVDDFTAMGAPEEFALGAYEILSTNIDLSDEDKVIKVIDACIRRTIYVDYPILIADTMKDDIKEVNPQK